MVIIFSSGFFNICLFSNINFWKYYRIGWDDNGNSYYASDQGPLIGQNLNYHYYVLCVVDLEQYLGGLITSVSSGSISLTLDQSRGGNGAGWEAGFLTGNISDYEASQDYYDQVRLIKGMSGTWAYENQTVILSITAASIINNKLFIGVQRDGNIQEVNSCSGSITATVRLSTNLNVSYNQGSGDIIAYLNSSYVEPPAPAYLSGYEDDQVHIAPLSPTMGNYMLIYNENYAPLNKSQWKKYDESFNFTQQTLSSEANTFTLLHSENNYTYEAQMKKLCSVTFQNSFGGGIINVNYSQVSAPSIGNEVVEENTIYASAINQTLNGISYVFDKWHEDNNGSISRTFTISEHTTWTADFIGRPTNNGEYVHFGTTAGQPIVIYWTDNPNSNVTSYQIWRRVKHNGVLGSAVNIATVSSGVGTYIDNDYLLTASYTDDLLYYDVRAYYSTEGTYSTEDYVAVYGEMNLMTFKETNMQASLLSEVPADYKIENYPNPFNPTTRITYQLPEKGNVVLKIYDALGKEIKTLINSTKEAGYYSIDFDASDLPSGVYIYQIQAGKFNQSKKMLLVK